MSAKLEEIRFGDKNERIEGYDIAYSLSELCDIAKTKKYPERTVVRCYFYVRFHNLWLRRVWCDFPAELITKLEDSNVRKYVEDVATSVFSTIITGKSLDITF